MKRILDVSHNNSVPELKDGRSLVLVGLMGAGKTCVGRRLAELMNLPFVDADHEIEKAANTTIADLFDLYGEEEFRSGERRVIKRLLEGEQCVLATGGGAFMNEETRQMIRETGTSLWLKADVDVLIKRTSGRKHRPLLNQGNGPDILRKLAKERYPIYEEADICVETRDESLDMTIERVLDTLREGA